MTKEEIQALINAKIAGQGSAIDAGGALPTILSEILELASSSPENPLKTITVAELPNSSLQDYTKEQMCSYLDISEAELDALMAGEYTFVNEVENGHTCTRVTMVENGVSYMKNDVLLTFVYLRKSDNYGIVIISLH